MGFFQRQLQDGSENLKFDMSVGHLRDSGAEWLSSTFDYLQKPIFSVAVLAGYGKAGTLQARRLTDS